MTVLQPFAAFFSITSVKRGDKCQLPLFSFQPGKIYHIQMGSIDGHVFIIVDGNLVLEVTDPNPIDTSENGRIGFEVYCTQVRFSDFYIKGIDYDVTDENYSPEF